jgi:hypothetical protein
MAMQNLSDQVQGERQLNARMAPIRYLQEHQVRLGHTGHDAHVDSNVGAV